MEAVTGIREEELRDLAIEIMNYADRISDVLNKYDNKFYELDSYYEGKSYNDLKNYYMNIRNQYSTVKNNIVSYSDDLIALIRKLNEGSDSVTRLMNQFEEEIRSQAKIVNDQVGSGK